MLNIEKNVLFRARLGDLRIGNPDLFCRALCLWDHLEEEIKINLFGVMVECIKAICAV
jgi:hypothetical protein